jgi:hypothetical protein
MSCCPKCGSQIGVTKGFCSKCGTAIDVQVPPPPINIDEKIKPVTNLSIGITIGGGAVLFGAGLFIAFSLNALYAQQTSYLASMGIQVNIYASGLDNMVFLISIGALLAMMGVYSLILGCLSHFNAKARVAMSLMDTHARIGNGFITGGGIAASMSSAYLIQEQYSIYTSGWFQPVLIIFIISGLVAITIGALLIRSSYLHSRWATKV